MHGTLGPTSPRLGELDKVRPPWPSMFRCITAFSISSPPALAGFAGALRTGEPVGRILVGDGIRGGFFVGNNAGAVHRRFDGAVFCRISPGRVGALVEGLRVGEGISGTSSSESSMMA